MATTKELKRAQKSELEQQAVILDLKSLVQDIDRCEQTIVVLQAELKGVNGKYPAQRTTRQDIAYLTDLLKCANKKLAWEKQIAGVQKRTPAVLERMSVLMNDPVNPPSDAVRAAMLLTLQGLQSAMDRLQNVKAN